MSYMYLLIFTSATLVSASSYLVTLSPPMPARLAGRACENNGMRLAHLTASNISNAAHLLAGSDHDAAWIASYEQYKKPKHGCLVLKAGDPATIAGLKKCHCRKMRHVAICESLPKDNLGEDTSDTISKTQQSTGHKKHVKRAPSTSTSEGRYLRRLRRFNPPRTIDVGIDSFRLPRDGSNRNVESSQSSSDPPSVERKRHCRSRRRPCKRNRCIKPCKKFGCKKPCKRNRCKKPCKRNRCRKSKRRISSSSSSTSSSSSRGNEPRRRQSTRAPRQIFLSESSSSSSSRSISVDINFSQEDAAILGSNDQPAIAFHHRHYSQRARREASSRSRSRTRGFPIL